MSENDLYNFRFPIGEFEMPKTVDQDQIDKWVESIANFPATLSVLTSNLSIPEKALTYRPDGWNIKQVVHHCADSHMNSFIRFKLTLTEDAPTIRPYFEDRWAELDDGGQDDLHDSLNLLTALHSKWTRLINHLSENDLKKVYVHPEHGEQFTLLEAIGTYAWHCEHHLGHIKLALQKTS